VHADQEVRSAGVIYAAQWIVSFAIVVVAAFVAGCFVFRAIVIVGGWIGALVYGVCMGVCVAVGLAGIVLMWPWTVACRLRCWIRQRRATT
jgi:hypothetical protein